MYSEGFEVATVPVPDIIEIEVSTVGAVEGADRLAFVHDL